jgi:DNA polymerase III subunit delta
MSYEELIKNLKKRQFAPLYLLMGEEPFYIDQISNYLEENVMEESDRDFNQVVLYGNDKNTDVAQIIGAAKEFPFGSQYKLVIVKEAKELKDFDKLKGYAENPSKTTILVIAYKYAKLKAAQTKPFEKNGVVFLSDKIKDYNLASWVQTQAKLHQFVINAQAASIIAGNIGNDLTRINNEFLKLKIFLPDNTEITSAIIEKYIGISKEYNVFELQNALGEQNEEKAYKIALNLCHNLKENPNVKTIATLYSFYSKMLAYRLAPDKSPETMAKIYGNIHPFILKINTEYAQRYSIVNLTKIISLLREFDMKSKGVDSSSNEEELLKELIYKILH